MSLINKSLDFRLDQTPPGTPALAVFDDFISPDIASAVGAELDNLARLKIEPDSTVRGGSRLNYNRGAPGFRAALPHCEMLQKLVADFESPAFFERAVTSNRETLASKGLIGAPDIFHPAFSDVPPFEGAAPPPLANVQENGNSAPILKIGLAMNVALSYGGYVREPHTDNRHKVVVGLVYLDDVEEELGGGTIFWNLNSQTPLEDCKRFPEESEVHINTIVQPKKGRMALFVNSNDGYHGVTAYHGSKARKFIYFSFASACRTDVWRGK